MKYLVIAAALSILSGCGDKDDDTGSDTAAVEDSTDTASE